VQSASRNVGADLGALTERECLKGVISLIENEAVLIGTLISWKLT